MIALPTLVRRIGLTLIFGGIFLSIGLAFFGSNTLQDDIRSETDGWAALSAIEPSAATATIEAVGDQASSWLYWQILPASIIFAGALVCLVTRPAPSKNKIRVIGEY